jgi:acetylornithine/N-succinyldiaminopimelate aminotransferase
MNASQLSTAFAADTARTFPGPSLMPITACPEPVIVRGRGSYLWDDGGKPYLDFIQGWTVNGLRHCPDELVDALTVQAHTLLTPSPSLHNQPHLELAELLKSLSDMVQVHFANSSAKANEAAIKLARKWEQLHSNGAYEVVKTENEFHRRTLAMMSASGKAGWNTLFAPLHDGFRKVPFGNASAMAKAITKDTVAIMVEPVQGEAGIVVPPAGYLRALRDIAVRQSGLLARIRNVFPLG